MKKLTKKKPTDIIRLDFGYILKKPKYFTERTEKQMSKNSLKKMIVFGSERAKQIIETLISDETIIENRSASALIEKHLMDDLMPENKNARFWIECLYSGEWGIGDVLKAAFSTNAAGARGAWSSKWDNFLPLVEFALRQESLCNTVPTGEELELHHFRSQLDSICKKLEGLSEDKDNQNNFFYMNEAKYARKLLKEANEEPEFMRYSNYYSLVIDNWDALKDWSITFRLLNDLAAMEQGWLTTPESRYELTQIIKELSKDWNA